MSEQFIPEALQKPAITAHLIHELLRQRWSPRAFTQDAVTTRELHSLFEAMRWAPSAFNEQPWSVLVALKQQPEEFAKMLGYLTPGNQVWAKAAPGLLVMVAKRDLSTKPQQNRTAQYDLGQAAAHFTVQAMALGLVVHQMAGVDLEAVRNSASIPEGYEAVTAMAFGRPGSASQLPEDIQKRETAPRSRKRLTEFVFGPNWGATASWLEDTAA